MKKALIIILLVCLAACSRSEQFKYRRQAAERYYMVDSYGALIFVQVKDKFDTTNRIRILAADPRDLDVVQNLEIVDERIFPKMLFKRIKADTPILISSELFDYFNDTYGFVRPFPAIDSLYQARGVLDLVESMQEKLKSQPSYACSDEFYYSAYLCWQNDIIWVCPDYIIPPQWEAVGRLRRH